MSESMLATRNKERCDECSGRGFTVGMVCCGDLKHGECQAHCVEPEQVPCEDCGGSGFWMNCPRCNGYGTTVIGAHEGGAASSCDDCGGSGGVPWVAP